MKYVFAGAVVVVLIFLGVLSQIPLGIEPLTEVYFEDHTSLRANIFPDKDYNFSFTVNNLEYQDMKYVYNVSVYDVNDGLVKEIGSGNILLSHNESDTIFYFYNISKGFERAKVEVMVTKDYLNITPEFKKKLWWEDPNKVDVIDIHFWTDEVVGTKVSYI